MKMLRCRCLSHTGAIADRRIGEYADGVRGAAAVKRSVVQVHPNILNPPTLGGAAAEGELDRLLRTGPFADALRAAIRDSGLSLDRVRDRLWQRDVTVSLATLSYWQSGRSRPERSVSLQALRVLEDVLGLDGGALSVLLEPPRPRGRRTEPERIAVDALWPDQSDSVRRALRHVDARWDTSLIRLSQHDRIEIDADGGEPRVWVRQVLRATEAGPDRWVLLHHLDEHDRALPQVRPLRGCRLGAVYTEPAAGLLAAELLFPRPLARGEAVLTEHLLLNAAPCPQDGNYERRLRLPVREYVLELEFTAPALPTRCGWFWAPDGNGAPIERKLELDDDHRALLVALDTGPGRHGAHWEF